MLKLAKDFYDSFVDTPTTLRNSKKEGNFEIEMNNIKVLYFDKGIKQFSDFRKIERRYRCFLALMPGSQQLFRSIKQLKTLTKQLEQLDFNTKGIFASLLDLSMQIEKEVKIIHNYLGNMEHLV